MSAPLTVESLKLAPRAAKVAASLLRAADGAGKAGGWVCTLTLHHPNVGGRGATMRITEVRRAIEKLTGVPADQVIEVRRCDCVMRCRPRLDNGGSKVNAYRLSPVLWNTEPLQGAFDLEGRRAS